MSELRRERAVLPRREGALRLTWASLEGQGSREVEAESPQAAGKGLADVSCLQRAGSHEAPRGVRPLLPQGPAEQL